MYGVACFAIFLITSVYGGVTGSTPTKDLFELEEQTKIVFYDFDKTTTIYSFGPIVRDVCNSTAIAAGKICDQVGDMTAALATISDADIIAAFGGQERITRLKTHWNRVKGTNGTSSTVDNIFILSTSWMPVPGAEWKNMISETLKRISDFDGIFPWENVLALDDPGPGISADKGAVALAKMAELGIDSNQCINIDDSQGNIDSQSGVCTDSWDPPSLCDGKAAGTSVRPRTCDTLQVFKTDGLPAGMSKTDLNYVEARGILPCNGVATFALKKMILFLPLLFFVYLC